MKVLVNPMEQMQILKQSLSDAPIIWKGDYPYFIHPITDGVPRLEPNVLQAIVDLTELNRLLTGIISTLYLGLKPWDFH